MKFLVSKSKMFQYICIYLCLLLSGSRIWVTTIARNTGLMHLIEILVLGVFVFNFACHRSKYRIDYSFLLIGLLTIAVVFVRLNVGGCCGQTFL